MLRPLASMRFTPPECRYQKLSREECPCVQTPVRSDQKKTRREWQIRFTPALKGSLSEQVGLLRLERYCGPRAQGIAVLKFATADANEPLGDRRYVPSKSTSMSLEVSD